MLALGDWFSDKVGLFSDVISVDKLSGKFQYRKLTGEKK